MPNKSAIRFTRPVAAVEDGDTAQKRPMEGERLEAPLSTSPYPLEPCHGVTLDARDVDVEEEAVRYRNARW